MPQGTLFDGFCLQPGDEPGSERLLQEAVQSWGPPEIFAIAKRKKKEIKNKSGIPEDGRRKKLSWHSTGSV